MPIRRLPPSVVNKIAAGEVIERPASVVKELMENSLDAGATRIDVSVEQGGMEMVRVADDGCGIAYDELPLAIASHATSKLVDADDLFRVHTFGFRGEALASISEVSRTTLKSRTHDNDGGWELEVVGGAAGELVPCGMSPGTTLEIRNLFYNTPVRRKFLRSPQTEMGHVTEAFTRLALANPHVRFTLRHNERTVYDLPADQDIPARIGLFFGDDLARDLIEIQSGDDEIRLGGYVARPSQSRSHPRMQYLFLNGRFIRDRSLQHALTEAYRGLLLTGRYPISFLRLSMPADAVDVNVHPTKLEVRFQDGGRIYSHLLSALRTKFLSTDLTHRLEPVKPGAATSAETGAAVTADGDPAGAHDPDAAVRMRQEFVRWAQGDNAPTAPAPWDLDDAAASRSAATVVAQPSSYTSMLPPGPPLGLHRVAPFRPYPDLGRTSAPPQPYQPATTPLAETPAGPAPSEVEHHSANPVVAPSAEMSSGTEIAPADFAEPVRAIQVHNRYLLAESDEGVLVIDQHALHERILYEQLRAKVNAGALESQALLVPEPVDLPATEAALVLERHEVLARLGIRVEPFGGDTILVSSYPAMLANFPAAEVLRSIVDQLVVEGKTPERRDLLDELLHMISCKAAIKAGDRLTPGEVEALLADRHLVRDTHHCPHGRPTALVFTKEELDKQFKRT
ncbi:MAG: DNA mismatch repair endonuclease MutL [Planctomycetales bacterium]|nr:DNA mismatch repair endonuclease MutL [Planctomycetales bacterium]MBN8628471.1 DNA mismatch repair endonuclease MutL [Planctomycetota bacterium]